MHCTVAATGERVCGGDQRESFRRFALLRASCPFRLRSWRGRCLPCMLLRSRLLSPSRAASLSSRRTMAAVPTTIPLARGTINAVLELWYGHIPGDWRDPATVVSTDVYSSTLTRLLRILISQNGSASGLRRRRRRWTKPASNSEALWGSCPGSTPRRWLRMRQRIETPLSLTCSSWIRSRATCSGPTSMPRPSGVCASGASCSSHATN